MKLKLFYGSVGSNLSINGGAPERLRREVTHAFTFPNPVYQQTLRYSPYAYVSPHIPQFIELAHEDGPLLSFPRGIDPYRQLTDKGVALFKRIKWADYRVQAPCEFPQLLVALNKEQKLLLRSFDQEVGSKLHKRGAPFFYREGERFGNLLYVSPTGTGKTLFSLALAKKLGQRTLVLFSTDQIKKAWILGMRQAFGIMPRDIGLIQRNRFDIKDPVTLGSVQTLVRRQHLWDDLFKQIGTLITDEADLVTAEWYWRFIMSCPARFILGVTATERGETHTNFYMRACFGETRERIHKVQRDTETSMLLRKVVPIHTSFVYKYDPKVQLLDWHDLSDHLMCDEERNQLIVHHVIRDLRKGIPVLLVTKRVAHVDILYDMLHERHVHSANKLTGETNTDRVYTEKLVDKVLRGEIDCVVATIQAIKRGANLNPLAALHLAMPVGKKDDLEQLIGRIRRKAKGKKVCKLIYYIDSEVPYLSNVFKRVGVPVFRRLRVPDWTNVFIA